MKRFFLFSIIVILTSLLVSCTSQSAKTTTTVTTEKVTYSDQGFYVEQQTVVKGNTVWGISEKVYGTGMQWRDIVALNPFLSTPDRLYYNPYRKMWIVRIYPNEVLNIGGQKVYPSCTYENTTTITTSEPAQTDYTPLWIGLSVIGGILLLALLFCCCCGRYFCFFRRPCENTTHVHIGRSGIEQSTNVAIVAAETERSYRFRERVAEHMLTNPNLTRATMTENSNQTNDFTVVTEYQVR